MAGPDPSDAAVARLAGSPEVQRHLAAPNTGVYIVRQDGDIVWASPSMEAVTGHAPASLVGLNGWTVFVRPDDIPEVAAFKAALASSDGVVWLMDPRPRPVRWYRIDTWMREDHILCAFHQEADPREQRVHWTLRARPAARRDVR